MNADLRNKTALVTASTGGIGLAIATGLVESGAHVILNGLPDGGVARAMEALRKAHPQATIDGIDANLSDATGVDALIKALAGRNIDVLINNAGIFRSHDFFEATDALWEAHWQINVMAGVRLARALAPAMVARGWGRIIFLSSEAGRSVPPDLIHYGVTKAAVLAASRGLAKRLGGTGVTVNAILPGPTLTDGFVGLLKAGATSGKPTQQLMAEYVKGHRSASVIGRPSTPEEVANLVVYVASPLSAATTGSALRVDGGIVDDIV